MRTAILVLLVGCAVDAGPPPQTSERVEIIVQSQLPQRDVCALASALPVDNVCSLMCDPDAMEQALLDSGDSPGRCYDFYCKLGDGTGVAVGVCLAPTSKAGVESTELRSAR